MVLIEPVIHEFAVFPTITGSSSIFTGSEIRVPRGCRATMLAVFGSMISVDDAEEGIAIVRMIADVNISHAAPYGLLVKHLGFVGAAQGTLRAAPQVNIDRVFQGSGRGIAIVSKGARSNRALGWAFAGNTTVATDIAVRIDAVYELIFEWLNSGATGKWEDDQDEEQSDGEG